MRRKMLQLLLIFLLTTGNLLGGSVSPQLAGQAQDRPGDEKIRVLISFPQYSSGKAFKARLSREFKTFGERHWQGIFELKNAAAVSQRGLLEKLHQMERQDLASNIKSHWIINVVEAEIAVSELKKIAARADVEYIFQEPEIELIDSPQDKNNSSSMSLADPYIQPNIVAVGADSAWALGYDGEGRIVCSFDTGVNGGHPALDDKWKGLDGDTAAAWFDPIGEAQFPYDHLDHGTRTMGIMVGQDSSAGRYVGVAPGARWITAAVLDIAGASMLDAFEWAVDPDGDPNTISDVPDVINHSWGVKNIGCHEYYWEMIDNTEALGIINIFACGNEGVYGEMTIRNPANRAFDSLDCFAVGATDTTYISITTYSSRGPSDCDTAMIKPNIVAPGNVLTTAGSAAYGGVFGTSFAAPHVSGAVAILRQYAPDATVDEIKEALIASCKGLPTPESEPNNTYGWGLLYVPAALEALAPPPEPDIRVYSFDHPQINPGETVSGFITIKNFGDAVGSVYGIAADTTSGINVLTDSLHFGQLNNNDTVVSDIQFSAEVSDTVLPGRILTVYFDIYGSGDYHCRCKIYIKVGESPPPGFFTHTNDILRFTVSNFGEFGFASGSFYPLGYAGFRYNDTLRNDMYEGALLFAADSSRVSDAARNLVEDPDNDFAISYDGGLEIFVPGIKADQETYCKFNDSRAENPIGLEIEQRTYSWNEYPYNSFVILEYVITNTSESTIDDLYAGLFFDWDLYPFWQNGANYDSERNLGYMYYPNSYNIVNNGGQVDTIPIPGLYRGAAILNEEGLHSAVHVIRPVVEPFDYLEESFKYATLSTEEFTTYPNWADISHFVSTGPFTLPPGGSDSAIFAVVAADSLLELLVTAAQAKEQYNLVTDVEFARVSGLPEKFDLSQNYPNPFNPVTTMRFSVAERSHINLTVYNLLGQRVIELVNEDLAAGIYNVKWDGTNSTGEPVASGIYFYKLTADEKSMTKKMLLLK